MTIRFPARRDRGQRPRPLWPAPPVAPRIAPARSAQQSGSLSPVSAHSIARRPRASGSERACRITPLRGISIRRVYWDCSSLVIARRTRLPGRPVVVPVVVSVDVRDAGRSLWSTTPLGRCRKGHGLTDESQVQERPAVSRRSSAGHEQVLPGVTAAQRLREEAVESAEARDLISAAVHAVCGRHVPGVQGALDDGHRGEAAGVGHPPRVEAAPRRRCRGDHGGQETSPTSVRGSAGQPARGVVCRVPVTDPEFRWPSQHPCSTTARPC